MLRSLLQFIARPHVIIPTIIVISIVLFANYAYNDLRSDYIRSLIREAENNALRSSDALDAILADNDISEGERQWLCSQTHKYEQGWDELIRKRKLFEDHLPDQAIVMPDSLVTRAFRVGSAA